MNYFDTIFETYPWSPSFMRTASSDELAQFRISPELTDTNEPVPVTNNIQYKYPPLPPSPVSTDSDSPLPENDLAPPSIVNRILVSSDDIRNDSMWRSKIISKYKTSIEIRRANDIRDAFALGNFMPVTVASIIRRVQRIKDAEHRVPMKIAVECWVLQHLDTMLNSGMIRYV
jgi:hypothetical protein